MERILIVEDSAAMRAYVRAALEAEADHDIVEATSGLDALRLLPRGPWTLVVTDINMPDLSGLELVAFIRRSPHNKRTPILVISTEGRETDRERAMALGADAFLTKPFAPEDLVRAVGRLLPAAEV